MKPLTAFEKMRANRVRSAELAARAAANAAYLECLLIQQSIFKEMAEAHRTAQTRQEMGFWERLTGVGIRYSPL